MDQASLEAFLKQFQGSGINIETAQQNPDWPIRGERFEQLKPGNKEEEEEFGFSYTEAAGEINLWAENDDLFLPGLQKFHFKALKEIYPILNDTDSCRKQCLELIESSEDRCAEVHNILALISETLEEALEHFQKALLIAEATLNWENPIVKEGQQKKDFWGHPGLRPYQRAQVGVALTLCKLKRWEEARVEYAKLYTKIDSGKPKPWSGYINWRYHYPLVLIMCDRTKEALTFMTKNKDCYTLQSTALAWCWNTAFCQFKLKHLDGIDVRYWEATMTTLEGQETPIGANVRMVQTNQQLWKLFLSHTTGNPASVLELPNRKIPSEIRGQDMQGFIYWNRHRAMWLSDPDIMDTCVRIRNRFLIHLLCMPDHRGIALDQGNLHDPVNLHHLEPTLQVLEELLAPGSDLRLIPHSCTLTNLITVKGVPKRNLARYLLELGRHGYSFKQINHMGLTPLNVACYYAENSGDGGALIAALILLGANPWEAIEYQQCPAYMTANQGNWLAAKTVLNYSPTLPSPKQLGGMFLQMVVSSCYFCMRGGPKCQRCSGGSPHDKNASFEKLVEVLVAYGLTLKHATSESLNAELYAECDLNPHMVTSHPLYGVLRRQQSRREALKHLTVREELLPPFEPLKKCNGCGATMYPLKLCSKCKKVSYCTRRCQILDWAKQHKYHCK